MIDPRPPAAPDWFRRPRPDTRPTPLFWWSGADLDRDRLRSQLRRLAAEGIGGTIVGYSHLPDGALDHGSPEPLGDAWWHLLEWFVQESAGLGMTVGIQDYGIIGPILRSVAGRTRGLRAGTLSNASTTVTGPGVHRHALGGARVVSAAVFAASDPDGRPLEVAVHADDAVIAIPAGDWTLSLVVCTSGVIGTESTDFDPLHPESGRSVIDAFYARFERVGPHLGTTFTTFFQDELDFGIRMPMWSDAVEEALAARGHGVQEVHGLWRDLGEATTAYRAAYRDVVVGLLEAHYFRPIFDWHEAHGTKAVMDQLSRGDLRLGHTHYADFMATMRWYHGPGNDDPDLTGPRNVVAFKVSSSIARHSARPLVLNEAFHSSGWGVTPAHIVAGANVGFVSGANAIVLHGLNFTTEGGWWEWASPDFHFRQPWWRHSAPIWTYLSRVSAVQRRGAPVHDIAVLDPTQDLDLAGATTAPEVAHELVAALCAAAVDPEFLPQEELARAEVVGDRLVSGTSRYAAVVLPGMQTLRQPALASLRRFADAGGLVIAVGSLPQRTEHASIDPSITAGWVRVDGPDAGSGVLRVLDERTLRDLRSDGAGLRMSHRVDGDVHSYLLVNDSGTAVNSSVSVRVSGDAQWWDLWSGEATPAAGRVGDGRTEVPVSIEPGAAALLVVRAGAVAAGSTEHTGAGDTVLALDGPWTVEIVPVLDNTWGDFADSREVVGVETWHVQFAAAGDEPWQQGRIGVGALFAVLGPVPASETEAVERHIVTAGPTPPAVEVAGGLLRWREYRWSPRTGVPDDPMLLDRATGPHGLKGVPDEYLDPSAVDPSAPAGSTYYFWSSVDATGGTTPVTATGRAAHQVWVGGAEALPATAEVPAAFYPPWGLRDLRAPERSATIPTTAGRVAVLVRVDVSAEQPTRVAVALGAAPATRLRRSRLRWWDGPEPAIAFRSARRAVDPDAGAVHVQAVVPPGAVGVRIDTTGSVTAATVDGVAVSLRVTEGADGIHVVEAAIPFDPAPARVLEFSLHGDGDEPADLDLLAGPLRWSTTAVETRPLPWAEWGLADFSGVVRYRSRIDVEGPVDGARLLLDGLSGTARVTVNGIEAGTVLLPRAEVPIASALHPGSNEVELEVANSLANHYAHWPSPYSAMRPPHGGFGTAHLHLHLPRS